MKRKISSLDEIISDYAEQYIKSMREKGKLTPEEKENMLHWLSTYQINKELQEMRPFVMGGYPKMMHDCITPYYQWIATIFILMGTILSIFSVTGIFMTELSSWVNYFIPAVVSILFGLILFFFIRNVKK